jgi:hypothetical protein
MTLLMADQTAGSGWRSGDKARLSPKRRRWTVENDEYGEFIRRILRAYSRRVADGDIDALSLMTRLADELDDAVAEQIHPVFRDYVHRKWRREFLRMSDEEKRLHPDPDTLF